MNTCNLEVIEKALKFAEDHRSYGVIIRHKGQIIAERYWNGWNENHQGPIYSATKSILSFLYGIALNEGHLNSLDQPITNFVTEWKNSDKENIHIKHLLGMCSGLECSFSKDFTEAPKSDNEFKYALTLNRNKAPEKSWAYNNTAYRMLFTILERATGRSIEDYARSHLAQVLGMKQFFWGSRQTDTATNYNFVHCSVNDLSLFGQLILQKGVWEDETLVSESFMQQSFSASQNDNPCYGLLWWLNNGKQWKVPYKSKAIKGSIFPDCPRDTVAALGFKDNKVYIVPSLDLVVTRLGDTALKVPLGQKVPDLTMSGFDNPFLSQICRSFLSN